MDELQQRLQDSEVECEPSPFLPDDFLRVSRMSIQVVPRIGDNHADDWSKPCTSVRHHNQALPAISYLSASGCCAGVQESEGGTSSGLIV